MTPKDLAAITHKRVIKACKDYDSRWIVPEIKRNNLWLKAFYNTRELAALVREILQLARLDSDTGCLVFDVPRKQVPFQGSREYAYRIIAFSLRGWPPRDGRSEIVRHICGNKYCIHPDHLAVGSPRENVLDEVKVQAGTLGATDETLVPMGDAKPKPAVKKRASLYQEKVDAPKMRTPSGRKPRRRT